MMDEKAIDLFSLNVVEAMNSAFTGCWIPNVTQWTSICFFVGVHHILNKYSGFHSDTEDEQIVLLIPSTILFDYTSSYWCNDIVKIRWPSLYCPSITVAMPYIVPFRSHCFSRFFAYASIVTGNCLFTIPTSNCL